MEHMKYFVFIIILTLTNISIAQPPATIPDIPINTPSGDPGDIFDNPISDPGNVDINNNQDVNSGETDEEERRRRAIGLGDGIGVDVDSIGIFGHDYLRTNNFAFYETVEDINVTDDYILGPGDRLSINLWAQNDIQSDAFTISTSGYIQQEAWGRVYLQGITYGEAKKLLQTRYSKFYNFDVQNFEVEITGSRVINVDIVGDVETPGAYRVPAVNTVYNVLKLSGGPTINGTVRKIQIKRKGNVIQTLDVYDYLNNASNRQNIYLEDNDVIYVPGIGKVIEIEGAVKKQTKFELKNDEDFDELLSYAGGFQARALKNRVQIFRYEDDQYVLRDFGYDVRLPSRSPDLVDGDLILVREVPAEANNIVTIEGAINQPGFYEYESGLKVTELITKAAGIRFDAITDKAYITRFDEKLQATNISLDLAEILENPSSEKNVILFPKDNLTILSKSDFASTFPVEVYGSVKKPGQYNFGTRMTLQDLLILAGGFKSEALNQKIELHRVIEFDEEENRSKPIRDLYETINLDFNFINAAEGNIELMPYDQIFVRSIPGFTTPTTIDVVGEVIYPGKYPLENRGMRVSDLIDRAGGVTDFAYRTGAQFFREQESTITRFKDSIITVKRKSLIQRADSTITTLSEEEEFVEDTVRFEFSKDTIISRMVVIDLNEVKKNKNSTYNYVLQPNDRLIIPPIDDIVTIKGAIRNRINDTTIINTAYVGDKNAKWYIDNYGGSFGRDAWKRTTQVVYPSGQSVGTKKFLWFNVYPEVSPGSEVLVDYKPPRDEKTRFFDGLNAETTLAIIGSLASTAVLIGVLRR